jgi:phenylalanyl-tRNA synthetase beta chain
MEVTAIERVYPDIPGVVVGEILNVRPHQHADRLHVLDVSDGKRIYRIVCGASNIEPRQKVPLALDNARLKSGIKISRRQIRGITSEGMLCSAQELGIGSDSSGILILPGDTKLGRPVAEVLSAHDWVFDIEIQGNRSDLLSVIGIAREIAAKTNSQLNLPGFSEVPSRLEGDDVKVTVEEQNGCTRYTARLANNIQVVNSPQWMRERLLACGLRPINAVVDITNYVLLETGQPLHAFDRKCLHGGQIIVRRARADEKFITLDEQELKLTEDDLVIADSERAIALAGVIGGLDSGITGATTEVLLESAVFDPKWILGTMRRHSLSTESSERFRRGVDPQNVILASTRATDLLKEICSAGASQYIVDVGQKEQSVRLLQVSIPAIDRDIGIAVPDEQKVDIMKRLGFGVRQTAKDELEVKIPSWRGDIKEAVDISEEIARFYGYENIPAQIPVFFPQTDDFPEEKWMTFEDKIREIMLGFGFSESVLLTLESPSEYALKEGIVQLENPLSEKQSIMRKSLIPGLIRAVEHNANRGQHSVCLFSSGAVYHRKEDGSVHECPMWTGVAGGYMPGSWWGSAPKSIDYYFMKGVVDELARSLGVNLLLEPGCENLLFDGSRAARLVTGSKSVAGTLGMLLHTVKEFSRRNINSHLYAVEIDLEVISKEISGKAQFTPLNRYPGVQRDISVVAPEGLTYESMVDIIKKAAGNDLKSVRLFDLYKGEKVEKGKFSMAFRLTWESRERTLEEVEVNSAIDRIIKALESQAGIKVRR